MLIIIRKVLSFLLLTFDRWFPAMPLPETSVRSPSTQNALDQLTATMQLYQFEGCPFCIKVRREMRRLGLNIELREAGTESPYRKELLIGGGEIQVPCLRINHLNRPANQAVEWMYESDAIIEFLRQKVFSCTPQP